MTLTEWQLFKSTSRERIHWRYQHCSYSFSDKSKMTMMPNWGCLKANTKMLVARLWCCVCDIRRETPSGLQPHSCQVQFSVSRVGIRIQCYCCIVCFGKLQKWMGKFTAATCIIFCSHFRLRLKICATFGKNMLPKKKKKKKNIL